MFNFKNVYDDIGMSSDAVANDTKEEIQTVGAIEKTKDESQGNAEKDSIYIKPLPNRLIITTRPPKFGRLSFFIERARKILRHDETLTITGVDRAITLTCTLVELLKRQKIAKVTKIATNMNLNPNFRRYGGNVAWGEPVPTIVFHLVRGEHATYVSDFQQRKVIEIFEINDPEHSGRLKKKKVEELNLSKTFLSAPQQGKEAEDLLRSIGDEISLPDFIRYSSLLIHPLLKPSLFKSGLVSLGIGPQEQQQQQEEENIE
ncbi:hypothetical protein RFI_24015 [Reticulomyxa filosa]|uniref:DNA/RNA-binding protein Alba-like domain-containing protein n=1 Tax=Reticulomyxa filosa TaxID=46433 RepID=X6MHM9_RETFI|nr:hypothetical protein RFI_24015 [Reticulomyxa filosa]|eukprot:ETO13359.1 hypothetical protein RFI_24015 [Reticulomyxa filosa]